jgi:hypothetical protein
MLLVSTAVVQGAPASSPERFRGVVKMLGGPGMPDLRGQETWKNDVTISATFVEFVSVKNVFPEFSAPLGRITSITYGQASTRHAVRWVAIGVLLAPIALVGLLHKSRKHTVLVSWMGEDGKERGAYFEIKGDHFRRLLNTLSFRTQKPIYADEEDRKWLLTKGVNAIPDPSEGSEKAKH